jgi:hypothetical protein
MARYGLKVTVQVRGPVIDEVARLAAPGTHSPLKIASG